MRLFSQPLIVLDYETTGIFGKHEWAEPIELGAVALNEEGAEVGRFPAMVSAITSPAGELLALHRTYLTRDGRKAELPGPVKKVTAASGHLVGGCIATVVN